MARGARLLFALLSAALSCAGMSAEARPGHGFVGYGIVMYDVSPVCPFACRAALSAGRLNCSTSMSMDGKTMTETPAACYATDADFLSSVAWCLKSRCTDMKAWRIEAWWQREIPGKQVGQPDPRWTYQEALRQIHAPPTSVVAHGDPLNATMAVSDDDYHMQATTLAAFTTVEVNHSKYGLVLLTSSVIIPIVASFSRFLPLPGIITTPIRALLLDRPLVTPGRGWLSQVFPASVTRGQALLLLYVLTINTALCAVGYPVVYPNAWWTNRNRQILTYVTNRAGVLSFANIPVLIIYAGRNNFLLWVTNWDPSTFALLHSFVAIICSIQAVLHSIIYLRIYVHLGTHSTEAQLPYWYWGIIATLALVILLPASSRTVRQSMYEGFLAAHFGLALLALVGCYLHILYKFQHQWGYELWIYIAFAIWGFDRLLRILRLARHGVCTALVSEVDENYIRIDVAGVADVDEGHAYLYFPTLTWRVWENHPFSVMTTFSHSHEVPPPSERGDCDKGDDVGQGRVVSFAKDGSAITERHESVPTLTFFAKVRGGTTSLLRQHRRLPVLLESGYPSRHDIPAHSFLLCIVGGVGITAVVPILQGHRGTRKLYWSCRSSGLVDAVDPLLHSIDKAVVVGARHDVRSILEAELSRGENEIVVLVSGPSAMQDEVRWHASTLSGGRPSQRLRVLYESFI